jgi:hypothetical protein
MVMMMNNDLDDDDDDNDLDDSCHNYYPGETYYHIYLYCTSNMSRYEVIFMYNINVSFYIIFNMVYYDECIDYNN